MTTTILQGFRNSTDMPFTEAVAKQIQSGRLCYLQGEYLKGMLPFFEEHAWQTFASSWNHLCLDHFMKDNGRYRLRRFSEWEHLASVGELTPIPTRPYVQPLYINPLNGGIDRTFEPFEEEVKHNLFFNSLVKWCLNIFEQIEGPSDWEVQIFQNRILAATEEVGQPTPEGAHRDGVTYILMMLIDRVHVTGGETTLYDEDRNELGELTLVQPLDCVLADDERTMHGVTPILTDETGEPGHRDMLIAMFTKR